MENASAIFYSDQSITGKRKKEELLAHEIAHQWFGNSATETDWPHVWLSEGFATSMANLYLEHRYGQDTLTSILKDDRREIIEFSRKRFTPIVDTSERNDLFTLLNVNSYQKGGWVLHMLRRKLGDSLFRKCISAYYNAFAGKNASTDDLRKVVEHVSGMEQNIFFEQWLFTAGHPVLDMSWKYNDNKKEIAITITQKQKSIFSFSLELLLGKMESVAPITILVNKKLTEVKLPLSSKPSEVIADPNTSLLFEGSIIETR